jgi:hypothetical protein
VLSPLGRHLNDVPPLSLEKLRRLGSFTTEEMVKIERKAMVNLLGQRGHFCATLNFIVISRS